MLDSTSRMGQPKVAPGPVDLCTKTTRRGTARFLPAWVTSTSRQELLFDTRMPPLCANAVAGYLKVDVGAASAGLKG